MDDSPEDISKAKFEAKLSEFTAAESENIRQPFVSQPMPSYPRRWQTLEFLVLLASPWASLSLNHMFHTTWFWAIPAVILAFLILQQRCLIRCPQCSRRLKSRTVRVRLNSYQQQDYMFYDCPDCKITWDPKIIFPVAKASQ